MMSTETPSNITGQPAQAPQGSGAKLDEVTKPDKSVNPPKKGGNSSGSSVVGSLFKSNPKSGSGEPPVNYICADFAAIYDNNNMHLVFDSVMTQEKVREQSKRDLVRFKCEENDLVYLYDPDTDQYIQATLRKRSEDNGLYAVAHWGTIANISVSRDMLRRGDPV